MTGTSSCVHQQQHVLLLRGVALCILWSWMLRLREKRPEEQRAEEVRFYNQSEMPSAVKCATRTKVPSAKSESWFHWQSDELCLPLSLFFPLNRYKFIQIIRVTKWDTNRIRRTSKHALTTRYREASKRKRFAVVTKAVVELIRGSLPKWGWNGSLGALPVSVPTTLSMGLRGRARPTLTCRLHTSTAVECLYHFLFFAFSLSFTT